jgi:hypothetical protein
MKTQLRCGPLALLCLMTACGAPSAGQKQSTLPATLSPNPTTTVAPPTPSTNFAVSRAVLSTGNLYVPGRYAPSSEIDIMVHFHGYDPVVEREFDQANVNCALVIVNYNGFSSVYSGPFSDEKKLEGILNEAVLEIASVRNVSQPKLGKLIISSFSAGYGATREILKSGRYDSLISDVILLDGLHSGYVGSNQPNPTSMGPFVAYATEAARGLDKRLIISHSSIVPGTYASTTETSTYLINAIGAASVPQGGQNSAGMTHIRSSDLGHFHVHGFTGGVAADHVDHLQQMGLWLKQVSLAK